ncbi:hypothetical protein [Paenibacillus sp. 1P03SA]|uniref:hypothetical protein n=1 Tax=Paenibacillus sp. 1P03SA TaxID=3132294 RepID=UPI0039A26FC4
MSVPPRAELILAGQGQSARATAGEVQPGRFWAFGLPAEEQNDEGFPAGGAHAGRPRPIGPSSCRENAAREIPGIRIRPVRNRTTAVLRRAEPMLAD